MKTLILYFTLLTGVNNAIYSQNIVENFNFEDTIPCGVWNNNWLPILPCAPWYQALSSSDYFSSSYTPWCGSAPLSFNFGYQLPYSGSGYVGFGTYMEHPFEVYREFIGGELSDSLITNHTYLLSMYVNAANDCKYYTDRIGLYLTNNKIYTDTGYFWNFIPQLENTPGNILIDTLNWVQLSGYYTAQGGEKFICIGNFNDPANTMVDSTYNPNGIHPAAYYYIDDVSVIDCTAISLNELSEIQVNTLYNAIDKTIKINTTENNLSFTLINAMGKVVMQDNLVQNEISAAALSRGVYMLVVEDKRYRRRVFKVGVY